MSRKIQSIKYMVEGFITMNYSKSRTSLEKEVNNNVHLMTLHQRT